MTMFIQTGVFCLSLFFAAGAVEAREVVDLPNRAIVTENILRGGRPSDEGLKQLKSLNVRTLMNLENDMNAVQHEMSVTKELGLVEISSPMYSLYAPTDAQVDAVLAVLQDSRNFPIYLHCKHGQDRTGMIVGLYRVFVQGWTPQDAYREMRSLGFHPILWNLDRYFKRRSSEGRRPVANGAPAQAVNG